MDVAAWLRGLGLEQYARAFRDNDVDGEVLPELTSDDLISIGVTSVGHRRKLLAGPNSDAFAHARAREPGYARNLQGLSDPHGQLSVPPAGRAPGLRPQPPMPLSPRPTSSPTAQRSSRRRCLVIATLSE